MPLLKKESGKNNSSVALLLIDVINDLDFDRADDLLAQAVPMVSKIAALKREAAQLQIPTVYVNDNFSQEVCFPAHGRALLRRQFARPGNLTGTFRLFRAQAETFRLLCNDARCPARISESGHADHHGNRGQYLRAVHRERRLHARLQIVRACGLRGLE